MRSVLVVAEMALSVVLLTGAGLLIRSFVEMTQGGAGLCTPNRRWPSASPSRGTSTPVASRSEIAWANSKTRLRALPGVTAVAATTVLPLSGQGSVLDFLVVGAPPPPPDINREIAVASITPRILRRDRRDAAERSRLHGGGQRTGAAGGDHQRGGGSPLVHGQDPIGREVEMSGGSRSRSSVWCGRPAAPSRPAGRGADVHAVCAANHARRPVRRPQRRDPMALAPSIRARDPRSSIPTWRSPTSRRSISWLRVGGAAALLHRAAGSVRRRRAGAGGDRHLRRDELRRGAALPRDQHPDGARRARRPGAADDRRPSGGLAQPAP